MKPHWVSSTGRLVTVAVSRLVLPLRCIFHRDSDKLAWAYSPQPDITTYELSQVIAILMDVRWLESMGGCGHKHISEILVGRDELLRHFSLNIRPCLKQKTYSYREHSEVGHPPAKENFSILFLKFRWLFPGSPQRRDSHVPASTYIGGKSVSPHNERAEKVQHESEEFHFLQNSIVSHSGISRSDFGRMFHGTVKKLIGGWLSMFYESWAIFAMGIFSSRLLKYSESLENWICLISFSMKCLESLRC